MISILATNMLELPKLGR